MGNLTISTLVYDTLATLILRNMRIDGVLVDRCFGRTISKPISNEVHVLVGLFAQVQYRVLTEIWT
ncbi:Uncharacterised protein [Vibrio cholerae]|nr:Uncharacterised protein [Vibrio cholerae]